MALDSLSKYYNVSMSDMQVGGATNPGWRDVAFGLGTALIEGAIVVTVGPEAVTVLAALEIAEATVAAAAGLANAVVGTIELTSDTSLASEQRSTLNIIENPLADLVIVGETLAGYSTQQSLTDIEAANWINAVMTVLDPTSGALDALQAVVDVTQTETDIAASTLGQSALGQDATDPAESISESTDKSTDNSSDDQSGDGASDDGDDS